MEREVGGGIGMGNTCKPLAVSFQCMTKSTTNKKKINKIKLKKKKIIKESLETRDPGLEGVSAPRRCLCSLSWVPLGCRIIFADGVVLPPLNINFGWGNGPPTRAEV